MHQPASGQHRLVGARLLAGRLERGAVVRRRVGDVDRLVPRLERALVQHQVEQLLGAPAVGHWLRRLATSRPRVGHPPVHPVEDRVTEPRGDQVEPLADPAGHRPGGQRPVLQRADHAVGGLCGGEPRQPGVGLGGRAHRRAHQREAHVGEGHVVAIRLPARDPAPHVERGLGGDVGAELRRLHLHAPRDDVDDVAEALLPHRRQQPEGEPHRAQEVDGHAALDVVEPVVGQVQRAPDRAAGVVDQVVDRAVLVEDLLDEQLDGAAVRDVGEVAGVRRGAAARGLDLGAHPLELSLAARDQQRGRSPRGDRLRRRLADPRARAGDQHGPPGQRAVSRVGGTTGQPAGPRPGCLEQEAHAASLPEAHQPGRTSAAQTSAGPTTTTITL